MKVGEKVREIGNGQYERETDEYEEKIRITINEYETYKRRKVLPRGVEVKEVDEPEIVEIDDIIAVYLPRLYEYSKYETKYRNYNLKQGELLDKIVVSEYHYTTDLNSVYCPTKIHQSVTRKTELWILKSGKIEIEEFSHFDVKITDIVTATIELFQRAIISYPPYRYTIIEQGVEQTRRDRNAEI